MHCHRNSSVAGTGNRVNLYVYANNDPLDATDPSGLWQLTISGGYSLVGGSFTLGYNSGQWSVGGWLGVGAGLSARFNPFDSGPASSGFDVSAKGQANYTLGQFGGGGFGLTHSFDTGTNTVNGSFSIGLGSNVSGTLSLQNDSVTGWTGAPTWGVGSSVFAGVGGVWTSKAGK